MNTLTEEQMEKVVDAIYEGVPDNHHSESYFGATIEDNNLKHLFTKDQMEVFHECELTYQAEDDDDECDCEDDCDCDEDDSDEPVVYDVRRSYPWSSGSWDETEESLEEGLRDEIKRVVQLVLENES
jgi:hypothetical protein